MTGLTEDGWLLWAVAAVWLWIAVAYRVVPAIDMPPGERVWTASALVFVALALVVAVVEVR